MDLLGEHGFDVEAGSGAMPTAFAAEWGDGDPVVATFAEYDAVPGNSQQRVPYEAPHEGLNPYAAGHTDPHSVLGVGALGGVLASSGSSTSSVARRPTSPPPARASAPLV